MEILLQSTLFALQTACSSEPSGSPAETATRFPSRSFGVLRFDEASDTTEKPVELSSDITDLMSAPRAAVSTTDDDTAIPNASDPASTTCTVFAQPLPS